MRFKVDENLPAEVVAELRAAGHDAEHVLDEGLGGSPDPPILARAKSEGRALLTMDKGIADIRTYPPDQYAGLVLLRPRSCGRRALAKLVRDNVHEIARPDVSGHLIVVTDAGIRRR